MREIAILDTTLRDGEQAPGCSMDMGEKEDVALMLCRLNVSVIEAGFPAASGGDADSVAAVASVVTGRRVAALARASVADIDAAAASLSHAEAPLIHIFLATSPLHMKYKLRLSEEEVIERAVSSVKYARARAAEVQFSAEDATRSDRDFLRRVFSAVIAAGATAVNIADTVGYSQPEETEALVRYILSNTDGIEKAALSIHCHDDLGLAVANTLAALRAGASQAECTLSGIGERAGNAALEEIAMALSTRGEYYGAETRINTRELYPACRLVSSVTGIKLPPNKAVVGKNAFAHEAGVHQHGMAANPATYEIMTPQSVGIPGVSTVLGKHSGRHAFAERLTELGFLLNERQTQRAFDQFKALSDKKKQITDKDLVALVQNRHLELPGAYELISFVINSGNAITSTALLHLSYKGEELSQVALGDGPVDAAMKAVNMIVGRDIELTDYSLRSVTEGQDALGEAVVKLTLDGVAARGRGLSTDVLEASIKAYINGVNKLIAELDMRGAYEG